MKYIVLLGDGMSDEPVAELDGQTPLRAAKTPFMDELAASGLTGVAETVPKAFHPGSDVANLSVFGYDPATCYSGRAPLEAASMGVKLEPDDVAFRLNLVNLQANFGKLYMADFSAGHISTAEAAEIIAMLQGELGGDEFMFYPGVSYRHLLVWRGGKDQLHFTPPHDISNQPVDDYLPRGDGADTLLQLMTSSQLLLHSHPVNLQRAKTDQFTANSIWLWGHGRAPQMEKLTTKFNLSGGAVISAVDLIKGLGIYAGLDVIEVPGATGYIDTNYRGKAEYALEALKTRDFVYLHVEAPDEAAHGGLLKEKIQSIESFDELVVGTVLNGLRNAKENFRILLTPDHPTPVAKMTHTRDAVPFVLYGSSGEYKSPTTVTGYSEEQASATGIIIDPGHQLMTRLIKG